MEIVSKALYRTILHKGPKKHGLHTAANRAPPFNPFKIKILYF